MIRDEQEGILTDSGNRKRPVPRPEDYPQPLPPRSPDRTSMQMPGTAPIPGSAQIPGTAQIPGSTQILGSTQIPGSAFPSYPTASRDYYYPGGTPVKRQRTSVDFNNRGIVDADGRLRQMDTYPQTAATTMYPNQYQAPIIPGYPTGLPTVPDYSVRQPGSAAMTPSSYGSPEDTMLGVRSPASGYVTQPRYPTYTDASKRDQTFYANRW